MGPITILDKSAFQSLSRSEHTLFHMWFLENVTPVLVYEIQGDLAKQPQGSQSARDKVRELARKFGGSGGVVNLDYVTAARQSILGATVPLTGQIIPMESTTYRTNEGVGLFVDLSRLNRAILRWAQGNASPMDDAMARLWREITRNLSFAELQERLNKDRILLPRPGSADEIVPTADSLLREPGLQDVWLRWLLEQLGMQGRDREYSLERWNSRAPLQGLKTFAPYAYHCLRALLALTVAVRHRFLKWDPTHLIDLQYLYYLPFCQVFVSDDRVHKLLAPGLMRRNQFFVRGLDFKSDLKRMKEDRDQLAEDSPLKKAYKFGSFPPQPAGSIVQDLWNSCQRAGGIGAEDELGGEFSSKA